MEKPTGTEPEFSECDGVEYQPSISERLLNCFTCRCDVNKERIERPPVSFFDLFRFGSKQDRIYVYLGIVCGILSGLIYSLPYIVGGKIASALILHGQTAGNTALLSSGLPWVGTDLFFALFGFFVTFLQSYFLKKACANITANLRVQFIASLLRQDALFLDTQKFGALNAQLTENIDVIRDGIGDKVGLVTRGVSTICGCIIFCTIVNWKASLINFAAAPISILLFSLMGRLVSASTKRQEPYNEKAAGILQESLINVKTVQCCNGEQQMVARYNEVLSKSRGYAVLSYVWSGFCDGTAFLTLYLFFAASFYYGCVSYFKDEFDEPGDIFMVPNTYFGAAYYIAIISPHIVAIFKARVAAAVIYEKIDRKPVGSDPSEGVQPTVTNGTIEFKDVVFGYTPERPILKGLTLTAQGGTTVAFVGHSGCGKSTAINLITRVYNCHSGRILIDGKDIAEMNVQALRRCIGIVRQEPVLFSGTITDNIRLGDETISDDAIVRACKIANAHDFVNLLAEGYNSRIGAGGIQLSGGQKQRIAIARAIVNDPKILLLDEATSALDVHSEVHVQTALKAATVGRTTIVIAHRLSTLRDADCICVINEGQVVEEGSHWQLKEFGGLYAQLVKAQEFKEQHPEVQKEEEEHKEVVRSHISRASTRDSYTSVVSGCGSTHARPPRVSFVSEPVEVALPPTGRNGHVLLYSNCTRSRSKLIAATVVAILRGFELPMWVACLQFVFIELGRKDDWDTYKATITLFLYLMVALGIYSFFTILIPTILYGWAAEEVVDGIKVRTLASLLRRDAAFFDNPETSNARLLAVINSDAPQLKPALDDHMVHFVNNTVGLFALLIQGFFFCWQIVLVGCFLIAGLTIIMMYFGNKAHKRLTKIARMTDSADISVEIIENVRTIQLLTREDYFVSKFESAVDSVRVATNNAASFDSVVLALGMILVYICDFVSYGIGIPLIYNGQASADGVFVGAANVTMTSWAIQYASMALVEIIKAKPAAEAIIPLLDDDVDTDGTIPEPPQSDHREIEGLIEAKQVHFAYPTRPNVKVANGLNLRAAVGQTIALVGPSGSGKSTIIQLLELCYAYQSGSITIDKVDLRSYNLKNLRSQMALVGQEPVLFSGSIYDNVLLGTEGKTMEDVREACRVANATRFVEALPGGYDTEVGEKGASLSGGQKQRIAVARAVVRQPKILLLDEATSALDSESERAVQEALEAASHARTCITIAHRLSSIQNADRIFFIESGRVVESGTHQELLEAGGKYHDLVRKQELSR